jgi:hypothetical protein
MSMSNVSQTRGNIEKPFIRALFRMPERLVFLLLYFGLCNHRAIYFFSLSLSLSLSLFLPCQQVNANVYNDLCFTAITILYEILQRARNMSNCISCKCIARYIDTYAFSIFI